MMSNKILLIFTLLLTLGCGSIETPEPLYHKGYEQIAIKYIQWPSDCFLPEQMFIVHDTSGVKGYPLCKLPNDKVDFNKWDVVFYNEGWYNDITALNVGSHWYINHELKVVRFEIVTRASENYSGLTGNGFTERALHVIQIPKLPEGYSIEITSG